MKPLVERHSYLAGASPQRPIEPVHSLMEEHIRRMSMQEEEPQAAVEHPVTPTFICPDCGVEHDGICQFGQTRKHSTCAACFEIRRMNNHKKHRDYVKELIRKDKEERKMIEMAPMLKPEEVIESVPGQSYLVSSDTDPGLYPWKTYRVFLELAEYKDLYDRIMQDAKDQVRTPQQQIIFELLQAHKGEA